MTASLPPPGCGLRPTWGDAHPIDLRHSCGVLCSDTRGATPHVQAIVGHADVPVKNDDLRPRSRMTTIKALLCSRVSRVAGLAEAASVLRKRNRSERVWFQGRSRTADLPPFFIRRRFLWSPGMTPLHTQVLSVGSGGRWGAPRFAVWFRIITIELRPFRAGAGGWEMDYNQRRTAGSRARHEKDQAGISFLRRELAESRRRRRSSALDEPCPARTTRLGIYKDDDRDSLRVRISGMPRSTGGDRSRRGEDRRASRHRKAESTRSCRALRLRPWHPDARRTSISSDYHRAKA